MLGLGVSAAQAVPLARYSLGGKPPAILGDFVAGAYAIKGCGVSFDSLFGFSRTSAAWKRNALGHWVKALAGEPRTGHHVWKGGKLVPAGIAVCSEVRANLVRYSQALDVSEDWSAASGVSVEPAGELAGNPAFRLTDANPNGYAQISQQSITHGGGVHVAKMLVAKDQNPTSQFSIRLNYSVDGAVVFSGMSLKVDTGERVQTWSSNVVECDVGDHGDHWLIWFAVDLTGVSNVTVQLFPAHNNVNGAGGAARVGSHVCTAVQLHPGRYPQDYIKTEAAAVDVASESLESLAVTLAKAIGVFGPELVQNANGSSGVTGWSGRAGNTLSSSAGRVRATSTDFGGGNPAIIQEVTGLTIGQEYVIGGVPRRSAGVSQTFFRVTEDADIGQTAPVNFDVADGETVEAVFAATAETHYIGVVGIASVLGDFVEVEGLSLKGVTMPEALTIAVEGFMTYEDEDAWSTVRIFRVRKETPTLEQIGLELATLGARTGQMYFPHLSNGIQSGGAATTTEKSPGVNVPFNYAWTIGDGVSVAASDGDLFVASAPIKFANILGVVASLAYRGDVCLTRFRLWAGTLDEVLTQAELQEVTS